MRAIKFRAFYKGDIEEWEHNGNARMIYDIQNAYDGTGFDDPEGRFGWVSCFSDFMDDEKMSVMQYTGLKDKNGTEIYEGDIVLYKSPFTDSSQLLVIEWSREDACFCFGGIRTDYASNRCEVIGNIYEHPHLLKE